MQEELVDDSIKDSSNFLPDNFKNLLEQSYDEWKEKGACKKEVKTDDIELEEKKTEEKDSSEMVKPEEATEEQTNAATKIQAVYRGNKAREGTKKQKKKKIKMILK